MNAPLTIHISVRSVLVVLGMAFLASLVYQIPAILTMGLVAAIIGSAMLPGVTFFIDRFKWPRGLAIAAMFAVVGLIGLGLLLIVVPTVLHQAKMLADDLPTIITKLRGTYASLQGWDAQYHFLPDLDDAAKTISTFAGGWLASSVGWAGKLLGGVAALFIIGITTFFLLLDGPKLKAGLLKLVPPEHRDTFGAKFDPIAYKLGAYVQGLLINIGFLATYLAIALGLAGVPLALALAVVAGMCELIPLVGSLLGAIPALLIALTVSPFKALIVLIIFAIGNVIQGNVVAPFVFARSIEVSPIMIVFALLIGSQLMGVAGAIIAVPVMAMLLVLVQNLYVEPMERAHAALHPPAADPPPEGPPPVVA